MLLIFHICICACADNIVIMFLSLLAQLANQRAQKLLYENLRLLHSKLRRQFTSWRSVSLIDGNKYLTKRVYFDTLFALKTQEHIYYTGLDQNLSNLVGTFDIICNQFVCVIYHSFQRLYQGVRMIMNFKVVDFGRFINIKLGRTRVRAD